MPAGRPRGGNGGFRGHPAPMSERQQLALLLQMTSQEKESGGISPNSVTAQSTSSEQHRASRSRCRNERGETPLHVAAIRGDEPQVRRLLARGSDPNAKDFAGWTPLHEACNHGWLGTARILIEAGASVNALGLDDDTPLHDAAVNGHKELVKLLVDSGADSTLKNKRGKTAVDVASGGLDRSSFITKKVIENTSSIIEHTTSSSTDAVENNLSVGKTGELPIKRSFDSGSATIAVTTATTTTVAPPPVATTTTTTTTSAAAAAVAAVTSLGERETYDQNRPTGSSATTTPVVDDSGAPCEMRRTPPQNKVDRSGTGQSGGSPRVTLRLNQVRSARDEKKGGSGTRHGVTSQSQNMDGSKTVSATSGGGGTGTGGGGGGGTGGGGAGGGGGGGGGVANSGVSVNATNNGSTSGDSGGDVYEFKSSKEPTPVRGSSTSPNPGEKDNKDSVKTVGGTGNNGSSTSTTTTTTTGDIPASNNDETTVVSASPAAKRTLESDNPDEQDDENRRKKRKDSETTKDNTKTVATGRQAAGRNSTTNDKCTKPGKLGANNTLGKNSQATSVANTDRKSPSSSTATGSSPKPTGGTVSATNTKAATPAPPESDGEDDRSKSSDSNSAPKVPPLKIVIPQSTVSEQEQGNRNGKNTSNRNHQLPYVVASSNSNDSTDKDQNQTASGTTSPTEGVPSKNEEKKDFSGALHGEERSTHHQRVLRSSHRSGNGANGSVISKEPSGGSSGNGNYSNSSPLPTAASATDRSNNSSPQQRHSSPIPETTSSEPTKTTTTEQTSTTHSASKATTTTEKTEKNSDANSKTQKDTESSDTASSSTQSTTATNTATPPATVELHPRKRKMKPNKEAQQAAATAAANEAAEAANTGPEVHPHDQPITNCYQLFLNIRKQIERRRKGLFPVQPKPPQGFKDYLMNRCTYVLAGNANKEPNVNPPVSLHCAMKDLYIEQEKERYRLRMQHVVEKEKLVLSVEQEILRVHGRAARALANQSLPFSVCTILKDEEVYNVITPEQEEKDRNARSRYNGRLFLSWLQDVDDKWEKIKEAMLLRHHNEAESLHAVQRMDWEWKMKEVGLCDFKARPQIEDLHVPMVHVSDDFDLLPA